MNDWFTIEKIDDVTYSISEYGHWERVHSYLLLGNECALLIDTGLGIGDIKKEVATLTDLPIKVVTTHAHWDHIGGHNLFSEIYVHKEDADWLRHGLPIPENVIKESVIKQAFSRETPQKFDINKYTVYTGEPSRVLLDNDVIDIGRRKIKVMHTPGHSPGHICLFEEEKGYLYTGDLIYSGTLYAFYPSTDPVKFKQSIDRISGMSSIKRILPSHNELNISNSLIGRIKYAFDTIEKSGLLKHGCGLFDFGDFKIHL